MNKKRKVITKYPEIAEKCDLGFSGFFIVPSRVFHFYTVATLVWIWHCYCIILSPT